MHFQLRRSLRVRVPFGIEITNAHDILESLRAHRAGIHAQAAADFARNSFHPFETAETARLARRRRPALSFAPTPAVISFPDTSIRSNSPPHG